MDNFINIVNLIYLASAILFIVGLKNLSSPSTAVRGNLLAATGMLIAIIVTLLNQKIITYEIIIIGIILGALIGTITAVKVPMTAMPQFVASLNGFGGGASTLVASSALISIINQNQDPTYYFSISTIFSVIIGSVTFFGSILAFGKLQGLISEKPILFFGRHVIIILLIIITITLGILVILNPSNLIFLCILIASAGILGLLLVIPIGGADMPVVISLLNSYSGLAAAATGFVLENNLLIISGSLVGAAGLILTNLMCKAMNRSLKNVLFGGLGAVATTQDDSAEDVYEGKVKSSSSEEIALLLDSANRVIIVPGYGMAVAQAQHAIRELSNILESKNINVDYAIHPVAGRMPGHMNVLLADADIPYEKLKEMDEINPQFKETDVVIIIGANDVVNPVANESNDPSNPIAGMPILEVTEAQVIVVIKRSLSPGFAGIPNPLFAADNTLMLFADAKQAALDLTTSMKNL
ncbi:MAG: NAD synthetase [Chloroflexi bacterium]|nr:NAD synthetase [Chloroflexota bacterium]MCH2309041.1 NAD(P)(+) transhydrogenase (Re/Si-specific) subunit beta [SAR202 cluster bacterium]MQG05518.1 NAD(P)(+) transhydrogenase (Re/Si-specific) subunit beta [SAR202 cluster bacterium]|tara:strand:+ start:7135 stop:8541 length:1407 start_codon:yes stop_codon:yes gene_type:complete